MVKIDTIELSLKHVPEFNPELAKTVSARTKTNWLVSALIATVMGIFSLIVISQIIVKVLGGVVIIGGIGSAVYLLRRKVDDSSEAQEERTKSQLFTRIRKAKLKVSQERDRLTNAAHYFHSFNFDAPKALSNAIAFNSYTVKVTGREESINVRLRQDKMLYRTEYYTETYTTKRGKLKSQTRSHKVPDRVKFTITFPSRTRAVKGVMDFEAFNKMISLYNKRYQKAQALAKFHNHYAIADANIRNHGDQLYFSPEEKQARENAQALAEFDCLLEQIDKNVPVEIDKSSATECDRLPSLNLLSDYPHSEDQEEKNEGNQQLSQYTETELRAMGLPLIRQQFNITARSYEEAFAKLGTQDMICIKSLLT